MNISNAQSWLYSVSSYQVKWLYVTLFIPTYFKDYVCISKPLRVMKNIILCSWDYMKLNSSFSSFNCSFQVSTLSFRTFTYTVSLEYIFY